ncbi:MAG: DNA recombination protein RmuC [Flammeovirgaceae bacterium]
MNEIFIFILGLFIGAIAVYLLMMREREQRAQLTKELTQQNYKSKEEELEKLLRTMKDTFGALSQRALAHNSQEFLKLANLALSKQLQAGEQNLNGKKALIEQSLDTMKKEMDKVQHLIVNFEKDRTEKYGQLAQQLHTTAEQTAKLREVTNLLKNTMTNSRVRGQWGERMTEDILRLIGMKEGVNYTKQQQVAGHASRPDFTFLLPKNMKVNMDVKFPFNNYLNFLNAEIDGEKRRYKDAFLKDVKARIREVTSRNYINPADHTVDYVLVFIPNEQVYSFIMEHQGDLLDIALQHKVVLCSPFSLYAILAVIRQAVDNFNLERNTSEMLNYISQFRTQWLRFVEGMDKMGKRIEDLQKEYHQLITTRKRQLDKSLHRIEHLKPTEELPNKGNTLFPNY